MTYLPRSHYELGDPVHEQIAAEEHTDHSRAKTRGLRLRGLSETIVSGLVARGVLPGGQSDAARVITYGILADHLYGVHAIDIPALGPEREDA
jgi:hypothetical protein